MRRVQLLPVVQDINQAEAEHVDDVGGQRQQEEEEVAIVPPADAVVHPRTVVVEILREHRVKGGRRECAPSDTLGPGEPDTLTCQN